METQTAIPCKNKQCSCAILPPSPGLQSAATHPHLQPSRLGLGAKNFLCPRCKHIFAYTAADARPYAAIGRGSIKDQMVASVQLPCGKDGCTALVKIYAVMDSEADWFELFGRLLPESHAHDLPCGGGHILSGPFKKGASVVDVALASEELL